MDMVKSGRLVGPDRPSASIAALNERSREVFREIVEAYVATGEPVGSRTLSRRLGTSLSPATIRNVMADLQDLGLLYARYLNRPADAARHLKRFLELTPDDPQAGEVRGMLASLPR